MVPVSVGFGSGISAWGAEALLDFGEDVGWETAAFLGSLDGFVLDLPFAFFLEAFLMSLFPRFKEFSHRFHRSLLPFSSQLFGHFAGGGQLLESSVPCS